MTHDEIKAADLIFQFGNKHNAVREECTRTGLPYNNVVRAIKFLEEAGFIKIVGGAIQFTGKGLEFQRSGKSYGDYLAEKKMKAERDDRHKDLQIQDLEMKLEIMNKEQLKFWNRQRWQFWLTLMIASAAFILSVINFIKSLVMP